MIRHYLFPVSALIVVVFAMSVSAQQQPAGRPAAAQPTPTPTAPAPAAAAPVALPMSKMAVIYSDLFLDQKNGIAKFSSTVTKLNGEFQALRNELTQMQTRAQQLEEEITKLQTAAAGAPIDQRSLQTKVDQLEQLKKDIQRQGEDAQTNYTQTTAGPVFAFAGGGRQSARSICQGAWHQRDCRRCASSFAVRRREHRHHARIHYRVQRKESGYRRDNHHDA